jgi:hypothetical protein
MSESELRTLCVDGFPLSTTRASIMDGLSEVVARLRVAGIDSEVWVDGSFMSQKIDPDDVDIVVPFPADMYEHGTTAQRSALEWVSSNLKADHHCDSYVFAEFPSGHNPAVGADPRAYWTKFFGHARNGTPKGIAVIQVM